VITSGDDLNRWLAEGECMAVEFEAKAKSSRWFWVRRYYRKLAAYVRADMADALATHCTHCGRPWQAHYKPEMLKFKNGPHGTFGLKDDDHTPHIRGVHAERSGDA
jgi:hypothetical protein